MMPTTPFQFELSQLVLLDREARGRRARCRTRPLHQGLARRGLRGVGRFMVRAGGWLEETARPLDIYERYGEGGIAI